MYNIPTTALVTHAGKSTGNSTGKSKGQAWAKAGK